MSVVSKRQGLYRPLKNALPIVISTAVALSSLLVDPIDAAERLDEEAIAHRLTVLPTWEIEDSTLVCTYQFENFVESVEFINQLVAPAEALAHHPDVAIAYNKVTISLTTHDAGGLTNLDFDLAETIATLMNPSGDRCI